MIEEGSTFDALRIYDGNSSEANLLAEVTGYHLNVKVSSTGPQIFITFDSDDRRNSEGFHANFKEESILPRHKVIKPCSQENPCHVDEGQCYSHKQCLGTLKCGKDNCATELGYAMDNDCCYDYCQKWLDINNGSISSPEYPNPYNNFEECIWTISAEENQTVLLQFMAFEVSTFIS